MKPTLYTKPRCPACEQTKHALQARGVAYDVVDITEDMDALAMIKDWGFRQVPVVVYGEEKWSGFDADKIKSINPGCSI